MRSVLALLFLMVPLHAGAQQANLICISVGDADHLTVMVLYGADGGMVAMQIPPDGAEELAETAILQQAPEMFATLDQVLRPGLDTLLDAPGAATCEGDTLGPVAIGVQFTDAPAVIYEARCPTPEILSLNTAMMEATGDPLGEELASFTAPTIPSHRDMCRTLP